MNFFKKEDILTFCWSNKKNRILIFIILTVLILFVFIWIYFYKNLWLSEISKITEYNYQNCEKNYNSKLDSFFVNNTYKRNIIQNILECEKMYDEINLFTELEYNVENKIESPFLYEYDFVNWTIEESWIYDYDIELNDNIDLEKSSFELYFSNDNLEWLEKIISNFPSKINWTLEEIISLLYIKNLYLNNKEIIVNSTINNNEENTKILEKIYSFQNSDWWFKKYILDSESDLEITFYINKILIKLKELGVLIDDNNIKLSQDFLNNNVEDLEQNIDYLKNKYVNSDTTLIEKSKLVSLLIDTNYKNKARIDEILDVLIKVNLDDYFLSCMEKSYLFEAFIKYVNKYSKNEYKSKFWFMLWTIRNPEKTFWIWRVTSSFKKYLFDAKKIVYDNEAFFRLVNIEWEKMNFWLIFKKYLKDYSEYILNSPDLGITRDFYEIKNEKELKKCFLRGDFDCENIYKLKQDNLFEKNKVYKVSINIKNKNKKSEIILENFIPDNFRFVRLNEKYSTNIFRDITYDNNRLKIIFDIQDEINFDYYIISKNKWEFDYYPSMIYLKENPENISSTNFYKIEVK